MSAQTTEIRRTVAIAFVVASLAVSPSAAAQAAADTLRLSLEEARSMALERNPAYRAAALAPAAARGELRQVGALAPNPELELEAPAAATEGSVEDYEAWAWQEIEWAGQRGLRINAAEAGLAAARSSRLAAARRTVAGVSRAFFAAVAAGRRLALAEEMLADNERLTAAVEIRFEAGEVSALDADVTGVETGQLTARALAVRRDMVATELELGRELGVSPSVRIVPALPDPLAETPSPESLDRDSLIAQALADRAELRRLQAEVERTRLAVRLAGREAIPNLRLGVRRGREGGTDAWGLGVGLEVPLWNRNGGRADRADAEHGQATYALAAAELRVEADVVRSLTAYATARERLDVYETEVLGPARASRRRLATAYQSGKLGLTDLLILRTRLLDAELSYWDAWLDARTAWIDLQAATAGIPASELDLDESDGLR